MMEKGKSTARNSVLLALALVFLSASAASSSVELSPSGEKTVDHGENVDIKIEVKLNDREISKVQLVEKDDGEWNSEQNTWYPAGGSFSTTVSSPTWYNDQTETYRVEVEDESGKNYISEKTLKVRWRDSGESGNSDADASVKIKPRGEKILSYGERTEINAEVDLGDKEIKRVRIVEKDSGSWSSEQETWYPSGSTFNGGTNTPTWYNGQTETYRVEATDTNGKKYISTSTLKVKWRQNQKTDIRITDYGFEGAEPLDERVTLFVEINRDGEGPETCKYRRGSSISDSSGNNMYRSSPSTLRWTTKQSFEPGREYTVAFQCYDTFTGEALTGTKTVTFMVGDGDGSGGDDSGRYSFDIRVVNSNGEGLENAEVRVYNSNYGYSSTKTTPSSGRVTFRDLRPRSHQVTVTCSPNGISESKQNYDIDVSSSGANQRTLSFYTSTDFCASTDNGGGGSDDGQDDKGNDLPVARLDVSTVSSGSGYERLKFDASGSKDPDGSITKYEFDLDGDDFYDDRTVQSGGVVYKTFRSDFYREVGVKVTDDEGGTKIIRRDLNVDIDQRDDDDDENGDSNSAPSIDLISPTGSNVGMNPTYRWEISDDQSYMGSVELVVDDDSNPFSNPLRSYGSTYNNVPNRANREVSFPQPFYHDLSRNRRYYWGIRADDGENTRKSSTSFYTGSRREDQKDGRLTVKVRKEGGGDLDARVSLDSGFRTGFTGGGGRVVFENLPRREFDVRVSKADYRTAYRSVDLEDDRTQSITVTLRKKEEDSRPEADFSYSPVNPEAGEKVSFDGGLSSGGNIIDYSWSFGDGSRSSGRQVTHRYDESGTYPVRLTVEQQDGYQDTKMKYVSVGSAQDECGVSEDSFYFSLEDYTIEEGDSTKAELQVFNTGSRSQDVDVKIKVGGGTVKDRTVSVPARSSRTVTATVSPNRDSFVTAEVSTSGRPCGFKDFQDLTKELIVLQDSDEEEASLDVTVDSEDGYVSNARVEVEGPEDRVRFTDRYGEAGFSLQAGRYDVEVSHPRYGTEEKSVRLRAGDSEELRFDLDRDEGEEGTLEVNVVDRNGDDIEDARVRVKNGDTRTQRTNSRGEARFSLQPDDYDIEVTHPDYDYTARSSVEIEGNEFHSRTLTLYRDDRNRRGIEIVSTDYPSSICRGDTLSVDYRVRNNRNYDESAQTTASGLGGNIVTNTYVIESGETVSGTLRFTNVEGSGREEFSIRVKNGTSDSVTRTVQVNSCGPSQPSGDAQATSVSMKLSYPIAPNRALVGDTVKVTGFVDGVNRRTEVRIDVNGEQKAKVTTQPDGYYQTYIRVDSPGMKTLRARAAGESASRQIEVLPTATVSSITAPRSVFEGETFKVCSQVNSQIQAGVFFYEDGRLLERENTRGETCFQVNASDPGMHTYEIRAATPGTSSSSTVSVQVMKTEVQARSFPDQIASVESGSGMVKVKLYNSNQEQTRYDLRLEGLPKSWIAQSSKQVILSPGESREVFFYLTPREEGSYNPEIIVEADNSQIYRQEVNLETGGQKEPRRKSFLEVFRDFFL